MLRELHDYWVDEVQPRHSSILREVALWSSLATGLVAAVAFSFLVVVEERVIQLTLGLLAYKAIVIGFSMTAATFAVSMGDPGLKKELATTETEGGRSAYSDLVFPFTWTALLHTAGALYILTLLACLSLSIPGGAVPTWLKAVAAFLCASLTAYGFTQFVSAIIAVSQAARVLIDRLQN